MNIVSFPNPANALICFFKDLNDKLTLVPALSNEVRNMWSRDPARGPEWRAKIKEWDDAMLPYAQSPNPPVPTTTMTRTEDDENDANPTDEHAERVRKLNEGEPNTVGGVTENYEVVGTFPSRMAAVTYVVTEATPKSGSGGATTNGQEFKMWIQSGSAVEYNTREFMITHTNGSFLNKKKAEALQRAGASIRIEPNRCASQGPLFLAVGSEVGSRSFFPTL